MSSFLIQPSDRSARQALDEERKIMAAYSKTATTYSQLSSALAREPGPVA
jgi:hypothetical protein